MTTRHGHADFNPFPAPGRVYPSYLVAGNLLLDGYTRPASVAIFQQSFFKHTITDFSKSYSAIYFLLENPQLRVLRPGKSFLEAFLVADPALNSTEMAQKLILSLISQSFWYSTRTSRKSYFVPYVFVQSQIIIIIEKMSKISDCEAIYSIYVCKHFVYFVCNFVYTTLSASLHHYFRCK